MFKLQAQASFKCKVPITVAGKERSPEIEIEFKYLDRKQVREFFDELKRGERTDVEALNDLVLGWSGVDTPFSLEALETLLNLFPAAATDLFNAFSAELLQSRRKN